MIDNDGFIKVYTTIILNYETVSLAFYMMHYALTLYRHHDACKKSKLLQRYDTMYYFSYFLNTYYNHDTTYKYDKKAISDIKLMIKKIDNLRHYKNEIIILTIIRNIVITT